MKYAFVFLILASSLVSQAQFRCGQNLVDPRDNQEYPTVWKEGQCWMAANLNYGQMIITGIALVNQLNNGVPEKFCYENDLQKCKEFGGLYQWDELMQYSSGVKVQGLCPPDWHIPSITEFDYLAEHFPSESIGIDLQLGGSSGFNFPAGGYSFYSGYGWYYNGMSEMGALQTSTESDDNSNNIYAKYYYPDGPGFYTADYYKKSNGYSARCLYDGQAIQSDNSLINSNHLKIKIAAMPDGNLFSIEAPDYEGKTATYALFDTTGRKLKTGRIESGLNQVSFGKLSSGNYIITVVPPDGITQVQQFHIL